MILTHRLCKYHLLEFVSAKQSRADILHFCRKGRWNALYYI